MSDMKVYDVMPACKLVKVMDEFILFGAPPEVIKAITAKNLPFPTAILIPDYVLINTNPQNAIEFPLYHFLFVARGFFKKKRLKVIGKDYVLENNLELLRLSLLGPSVKEFDMLEVKESVKKMLLRESEYFSLKDDNGDVVPVSDLIENFVFDISGQVSFSGITVESLGENKYFIEDSDGNSLDINIPFNVFQKPPYPIIPSFESNRLYKFGVKILGGSNGFSSNSPCSGLMVVYNGMCILIDCIPYIESHLHARGISKSEIGAIFLSHIHDDHCNLIPLMYSNFKIKIITTREIYWMAMAKLALMLNVSIKEVVNYFEFLPIVVGETFDYYGLKIDAHYAVHSIPTIGARFYLETFDKTYSILMTSDNQSLDDIDKMYEDKSISVDRRAFIHQIYSDRVDILFADGGEGGLHGSAKDALNSNADRVVFFHIDKLPGIFDATFSLASAGKNYVVVKGNTDFYISRCVEILVKYFSRIDINWFSVFMDSVEIMHYNIDDVIINEGAISGNKIYIIVTGYCKIIKCIDGKRSVIAIKEAGDIFGEMAIITGEYKRNASVVASSPVAACIVPEDLFYSLIVRNQIKSKLLDRWSVRFELDKIALFSLFHHQVINKLASFGEIRNFSSIDFIDLDKYFYIILDGFVAVEGGEQVFKVGDFFGYYSYNEKKNLKLIIQNDVKLLVFHFEVIRKILSNTPALLFYFRFCNRKSFSIIHSLADVF